MTVSVLFVCLGNICRSPTAHAVFEKVVSDAHLSDKIIVDSAGTGDWHIGEPPDHRASSVASRRGYPLDHLRARQVVTADFDKFDYILAMDNENLRNLQLMAPLGFSGHLGLFLAFDKGQQLEEVPDPYYGGPNGFDDVMDSIEKASSALLSHIQSSYGLP